MRLPTYASGSGASSVRDAAAAQDDMPGMSPVNRGDAARECDSAFAELEGDAASVGEVVLDAAERAPWAVWLKALNTFRLPAASGDLGVLVADGASSCCKNVERIDESDSPRVRRVRAGSIPPRSSEEAWRSMTASTFRGSELGVFVLAEPMARSAARPSIARRNRSPLDPCCREEPGERTTQESLRGAPAKMPMRPIEVLRVATGARIASGVASCAIGAETLVTARPAPVPVNWMFTVVAEADVAGPVFGEGREETPKGPRPRLTP